MRRRRPILNHLQARHAPRRRAQTYEEAVLDLATMPGEQLLREVFTPERLNGGFPNEVYEAVDRATEDDARRRVREGHPSPYREREQEPITEEPQVSRRSGPSRSDIERAEVAAALYVHQHYNVPEPSYQASSEIERAVVSALNQQRGRA